MSEDDDKKDQRAAATAMVSTFLHMARSVELARKLSVMRERAINRRQSSQYDPHVQPEQDRLAGRRMAYERAAQRFRDELLALKKFEQAGLTQADFDKLELDPYVELHEPEPEKPPPAWRPGSKYGASARVSYGKLVYVCTVAHVSHVGWEPVNMPRFWRMELSAS